MIHHKDFPFDEESSEREIVHLKRGGAHSGITVKVILLALLFASIMFGVKYLYDLGRGSTNPMDVPLIAANHDPYKSRPEDPGGMQIPHIDKEIFDGIDPNFSEEKKLVKPIDEYEKPMVRDPISDLLDKEERLSPTPKPKIIASSTSAKTTTTSTSSASKPKPKIVTMGQKPTARKISSSTTRTSKKIDIEKVLAKQQTPEYWVQLGTFDSEEKATKAWQDVSEKNSDLLKDVSTKVSKSDLGDKGIFYRLKSGPLGSDTEAKALCKKLNERKQNCFFVKDEK